MAFNLSSVTGAAPAGGLGGMPQVSGLGGTGLMDESTKDFSDYNSKYLSFENPEGKIEIEDTVLGMNAKGGFSVNNIVVELTSNYEAGMAHFRIYNVYSTNENKYSYKGISKQLQIAAKVTISLGYSGNLVNVFSGFIAGYNFIFEEDDEPYIEVTAIDIKGAMMSNTESRSLKGTSYSACVTELLSNARYSKYILGQKIETTPDDSGATPSAGGGTGGVGGGAGASDKTIEMVDESDYEFILKAAKKFGYEFFISQGTVFFRKPKSQTQLMARLGFSRGILFLDAGYSIMGIVKTIEARSTDAGKGKLVTSKTKINKKYSDKSFAKELLKSSIRVYVDPTIRSSEDAKHRVASLVEDISYRFGSLSGDCVGIPDLIPGRFIELINMGEGADNRFYITEVKHTLDSDNGFTTKITGKTDAIDAASSLGGSAGGLSGIGSLV